MSTNYWEENYSSRRFSNDYDGWLGLYGDFICPGKCVLDLGCGAGTNIGALLELGAKVTAADFSENAVAAVRENLTGKISGVDCFDMREGFPYPDGAFDAVVADLSLHYFSWADTCGIIAEIHRILKNGGRLVARVHSLANLEGRPEKEIEPGYYMMYGFPRRYFSVDEISGLFANWNLRVLQEKEIHRYGRIKHVIEFVAEKL